MADAEQNGTLFEDLEGPAAAGQPKPAEVPCNLKLRRANRDQLKMVTIDVEQLIPPQHKARAIWYLTGKMDLSVFFHGLSSVSGGRGRRPWDPRLLVSVWLYALSEGITSSREIEKLMEWESGLMWLGAIEPVNHTSLNDFRKNKREALDEVFTQLLVMLEGEGLVDLERVMLDGTKVAAQAGRDTFRREKTLQKRLAAAREVVQRLEKQGESEAQGVRRAAREQEQRLEQALQEMKSLQGEKKTEEEKAGVRVSLSDPEARIMKHGDGAIGPAYNLQISTDAKEKVIVGMQVNQCSADAPALAEALEGVQERMGRAPAQMVVDGGYTSKDNVILAEERKIDLIGSPGDGEQRVANAMKSSGIGPGFEPSAFVRIEGTNCLQCPAGKVLAYVRQSQKRHTRYAQYEAQAADCAGCAMKSQCCPKREGKGRTVSVVVKEHEAVTAFRQKMEQAEAKAIYKQRGAVAEFPNAWIKDKINLWKFRLRGLAKVATEALWACFTYNVMVAERLVWRGKTFTAEA
ncbi:MAG: IS1182 family transposase [Acidobacteria bacterium]|nr:IS1182 family transposase [Acidobacteriota bacterium]